MAGSTDEERIEPGTDDRSRIWISLLSLALLGLAGAGGWMLWELHEQLAEVDRTIEALESDVAAAESRLEDRVDDAIAEAIGTLASDIEAAGQAGTRIEDLERTLFGPMGGPPAGLASDVVGTLERDVDRLDSDVANLESSLFGFAGTPMASSDLIGGLQADVATLDQRTAAIDSCVDSIVRALETGRGPVFC